MLMLIDIMQTVTAS